MLTPLLGKISEYLPNHGKCCVKNILTLSLCVLIKETVNLNKGYDYRFGRSAVAARSKIEYLIC